MKIKKILWQNRRDFSAIYECEHCEHTQTNNSGYDDAYYHANVIPKMKCENCGEVAGDDYRPLTTKYPDGQVI